MIEQCVILSAVALVWALAKIAAQARRNRALLRRVRETGVVFRIDG